MSTNTTQKKAVPGYCPENGDDASQLLNRLRIKNVDKVIVILFINYLLNLGLWEVCCL